MPAVDLLLALLIGLVQGVVEWLPMSSEGAVSILLSTWGYGPTAAVQLALFLHAGTALAATVYYRSEIRALVSGIPQLHPHTAFEAEAATLSFFTLATVVSAAVGLTGYYFLLEAASELAGGAFIALIGGLLVLTGVKQRLASEVTLTEPEVPRGIDAVLVGIGQGLAALPGISRSGTTVSVLLLRGYDGESAFEFSFILSSPRPSAPASSPEQMSAVQALRRWRDSLPSGPAPWSVRWRSVRSCVSSVGSPSGVSVSGSVA